MEEEDGGRGGGRRREERGEEEEVKEAEKEKCAWGVAYIWSSCHHIYLLVCQLANFLKRKWAPVHFSGLPPYGKPYKDGHKQNGQCGDVLTRLVRPCPLHVSTRQTVQEGECMLREVEQTCMLREVEQACTE